MASEPIPERVRRYGRWLYLTGALVYGLDRATKLWAEHVLAERTPIDLIPNVLQLRFTTNPGGAFSLFGGSPWLFALATLLATVAIVLASRKLANGTTALGLGMILGGAIGNFTDRAVRGAGRLDGSVVDFIDFHVWPVFNVADMGIVIGAGLVLLGSARASRAEARDHEERARLEREAARRNADGD